MLRFTNTPWSFSVLDAFDTCPRNYNATRWAKTHKEVYSKAKAKGTDVHEAMQAYVERGVAPPIGLQKFKGIVDKVTAGALDTTCEIRMGMRSDLSPCDFFDHDVCYRGQFDLNVLRPDAIAQLDFKTGQPRESELQLKLYGIAGMQRWGRYDETWAAFVYTQYPSRTVSTARAEIPDIVQAINPRLERLRVARETGDFPERQCWKCRFCPVKECRFWQPPQARR